MNLNKKWEKIENSIQEMFEQTDMDQKLHKYFEWYQRRLDEYKKITADILFLQDKLDRIQSQQQDIIAHNRELETIAMYDSLTGLANRSYLNEYLSQKFEEAFKQQKLLGIELMDIDHFKTLNDTYGHLTGDACLEAVGKVLQEVRSYRVFCARYGGDEFMIVYCDMTVKEILAVAEAIQNKVRQLEGIPITVTQGIFAHVPQTENREWDFNSMADTVLYHAKREGRNRYRIATEFDS